MNSLDEDHGIPRTNGSRLCPAVHGALRNIAPEAQLTPVLEMRLIEIAEGLPYKEIARTHEVTMNTVKTEARHLYRSIGVNCRHEIGRAAEAAQLRAEAGATVDEIAAFLRVRFE